MIVDVAVVHIQEQLLVVVVAHTLGLVVEFAVVVDHIVNIDYTQE